MLIVDNKYKSLNKLFINEGICNEASDALQIMLVSFNDDKGTDADSWVRESGILVNNKIDLGKNGFITLKQLKNLYKYAKQNNKPCPMIGNYKGKLGDFVFRRWVGAACEQDDTLLPDVTDISAISGHYKGLHNTNMKEDGRWFPSSEDMESVIAYGWNKFKNRITDDIENIQYVTSHKPEPNSKAEQLMAYYAGNQEAINAILDKIPDDCGALRKLATSEATVQSSWAEFGKFDGSPDRTPKTDIIANNYRISLKKAGGSQLMSGLQHEAMATLVAVANQLKSSAKIKTAINKMFKQPWASRVDSKNKAEIEKTQALNYDLSAQLQALFKNETFRKAVFTEAATGRLKFGESSPACADHVLVWDDVSANKCKFYEIDDYVNHVEKEASATINIKSSNDKSSTALRIITK